MAATTPPPSATPSTPTSQSQYIQTLNGINGIGSPLYNPTTTKTTYLTQTSQPDIAAMVNGLMQQLVGRNATAQEIQQYGAELLAAESSNVGTYSGLTTYGASGKRNLVSGEQVTAGVDPNAFLTNLIEGTADAKSYRAATQYFDGMTQALQNMKVE
jgi:hypothetical protein